MKTLSLWPPKQESIFAKFWGRKGQETAAEARVAQSEKQRQQAVRVIGLLIGVGPELSEIEGLERLRSDGGHVADDAYMRAPQRTRT
jgi:hypothetical protein